MRSWLDYTSQNYRMLFNSSLWWPCMIKKLLETMEHRTISNFKLQWNFIVIRWCEIQFSESEAKFWNEDQLPRIKKETKFTLRGKCESVVSGRDKDNVPKETHVVSVMTFQLLETRAKVRDEKGDRLLPHPIRRQNRLTERDKHRHMDQAINRKTL